MNLNVTCNAGCNQYTIYTYSPNIISTVANYSSTSYITIKNSQSMGSLSLSFVDNSEGTVFIYENKTSTTSSKTSTLNAGQSMTYFIVNTGY